MNSKKISVIIQARMGSKRLPGKILRPIMGKPMLWHIVNRVRKCNLVDKIIIATTETLEDDQVYNFCMKNKIDCFRGSELDVLDRYYQCAVVYNIKHIVRLTGDNALVDPDVLESAINYYFDSQKEYISYRSGLPLGLSVELFIFAALKRSWEESTDCECREHVTVYMYRNGDLFNWEKVSNWGNDHSDLRLTVDTEKDFLLITKIYEKLYEDNEVYSLTDVYNLLEREPGLLNINRNVRQKQVYYNSLNT